MDIFEDFLKTEKKLDLYNKEVLGMKYWEFIRFGVLHEITIRKNNSSDMLAATRPKGLRVYLLNLKKIKNYLGICKIPKVDLLVISHPRRIKQGNKFYNIFIDPIVESLSSDYKCLTLEEPCWCGLTASKTSHFFPVGTKNIYFTDLYELLFLLKSSLFKVLHYKKYKKILSEINKILLLFDNKYDVDLHLTKKHFVDKIIYNYTMKKMWKKIVQKINPKAVLLHYFPTSFKVLLINICNELGIPTIELQHGIITYSDPAEHKTYDINDCFNVPKYLFAFGNKIVNKKFLTTESKNIKFVGFPFLEKKVKSNYELPLTLKKHEKYILFISQDMLGKELSKFASKLSELLKDKPEYKIIYKYHPNEGNIEYKCLNKENIISIKKYGEEIYKYQHFSCLQVGVFSTSLYEGLAFGLPTIILKNLKNANQTLETLSFIKKGVYAIERPEQVIEVLNHLEKPQKKDIESLWKNNSINNIRKQLKIILKH